MFVWLNRKKVRTKSKTVGELLKENGLCVEDYIIEKNGAIVPQTEKLKQNDKIRTIKIISGG